MPQTQPGLTADEKTAKRIAQIERTKRKTAEVEQELQRAKEELGPNDAQAVVQRHIRLLHRYNAVRDVGSGLFGLIADKRGVRLCEVFEEYGVKESD